MPLHIQELLNEHGEVVAVEVTYRYTAWPSKEVQERIEKIRRCINRFEQPEPTNVPSVRPTFRKLILDDPTE